MTLPSSSLKRAMLSGVERDVQIAYGIGGLHGVLGVLNARTRFRMTVLCPSHTGPRATLCIYDRDHPRGTLEGNTADLCSAARAMIQASGRDGKETSATSAPFASRAGAIVGSQIGAVWGVLFHHDARLRVATPDEQLILEHLASRLPDLFPTEFPTPD